MLALAAGSGDWAKTIEACNPLASLTLRIDREAPNTRQRISGLFGCGDAVWIAELMGQWMTHIPPFPDTFTWQVTLTYMELGAVVWTDASDNGTISDPGLPTSISRDFVASFSDLCLAERNTYVPVRGTYVEHFDEIVAEGSWYVQKDVVSAEASFGTYSKAFAAGAAFSSDQLAGYWLSLVYDWADANGSIHFDDIAVDGHAVPCGDLDENVGHAVGNGDDITCDSQAWTGQIWPPITVLYHCPDAEVDGRVLSPVCRMKTGGGIEPYPGVPVVDDLMTLRDSVASKDSEDLHGFDSGLLWKVSWSPYASPSWAAAWFTGGRSVAFPILASWAAAAGAEEDEKNDDLTICLRGYPLNNRTKTTGRTEALTFAHLGAQEVEFPEGAGTRRSNWVGSGAPITVTNGAASTRVQATGNGYAERVLVNRWATREPQQLKPIDADEDFWNWSNYGALAWDVTATWAAAADRDFELLVTYEDNAGTPFSETYLLHISEGDKGNPVTVISDLGFPDGATALPRLYRVTELRWQNLVNGDDFTFTSMELVKQVGNEGVDGDSTRLQLSFPDSKDGADRFGCAGLVRGQLTFDDTDRALGQAGAQQGIAHYYSTGLRVLEEAAPPYGLVDVLNYQQGWTASAVALGNALEDADGNVLIGPAMMLLEEQFDTPAGSLYLSPRFASYTVPYGATYTARPHKILRGAFHGVAATDAARTARAPKNKLVPVLLCSGGSPTADAICKAKTDAWGHWVAGKLYEDLQYAVRYGPDLACHSVVNVEARWVEAMGVRGPGRVGMFTDPMGVTWLAYVTTAGALAVKYIAAGYATWSAAIPVAASPPYTSPGIEGDGGRLHVAAAVEETGVIHHWYSENMGDTWTGPDTVAS